MQIAEVRTWYFELGFYGFRFISRGFKVCLKTLIPRHVFFVLVRVIRGSFTLRRDKKNDPPNYTNYTKRNTHT